MKKVLILFTILGLCGCSVYGGKFECDPSQGVGCKSVSTVDKLINDNALEDVIAEQKQDKQKKKCRQCDSVVDRKEQSKEMKVYFHEYTDEAGVIHKPHDVSMNFDG